MNIVSDCKCRPMISYNLFGSSSFITKADDKTAVFYNGSKTPKTIRPYLMPDELFIQKFNENMEEEKWLILLTEILRI